MSESTLKPFTGKLDENNDTKQQPALKPFTGALDGEKKGVMGHLKDTGISALKGAVAVPELAVGIMDVMSDGATGKTLEETVGFRPKEAKQALSDFHTDQYKAQQQEFADAGKDGSWADKVVDKTKVALTNPSLIANTVVESVPSMLAGGVLGRASGIANPVVAGAVGEGAVMAGSQAEQIRQETVDGRLTADQSLAGATTGVLGGLIGFAGGRIAQKLGIGDVDTMLVNGKLGPAEIAGEIAAMPAKSLPRRVVEGAISEGFLEELPQSVSEQILQNLALDKPWSDGIEDAAVMGTLAGMAMGGAANILSGHNTGTDPQDNQQQSGTPNLPSVPPQLGSGPDNAMSGEYIPRENAPQGDNQGRTAFVYDQPSMDADNLLSNNYEGDADFNTSGNLDPSNNPLSPSGGNYFEDHSTLPQLPSEHLGINPNDGPMSSAAALAVDSGASQMLNMSQNDAKNEGPLSGAVPSEYQSLLASNNKNTPVVTNGLDRTSQLNDGDVSQSAITEQKKGIENPETAPPNLSVVMGAQSKVTELETQLANEKSVIKKVRLRKQIVELQKDNPIDQAAHAAATSIQNDLPEPSQAQIEAGNYKKGHIKVHGLDIAVENPRGSERRGTDPDGKEWAHTMSDHYGYIKRTTGADNENIDTYVGNNPESEQVFIVDQIDQKTGGFDEHKVMMGFNSKEDAIQAYSSNFDKGWKVGAVRAMNKDEFKSWLKDGDTKKPAGDTPVTSSTINSMRKGGKTEKVYTPSNREIEVRHKLVEADSLIASNHGNGSINEKYPQQLQPRDRTRPSSQAQVNEIATNLNPKLLGESPSTANGAPIVSNDNVVESGNGRIMAVRKAYEQGKGEAYKQWLFEQGYDVSKMKNPVLVRERLTALTDQERVDYTKESNERTTLDLSPTERAIADADSIKSILEDYAGGDLNNTINRAFVNKFVTGVVSTNERASVIGTDKALTQQGKRRIQGALVAAAYGDSTIINQVFEDTDSEIKSIGNALTDVAGIWGLMRKMAQQGTIPAELDITPNLIEAVHLVHKARTEKRKLIELVAQDDIFAGEIDQVTKDFLSIFYRGDNYTQARSREKVADALSYYANQAQQIKPGTNLFGDAPQSETNLIRETHERQQNQEADKQPDIFASSQLDDANVANSGGTGQRTLTKSTNVKAQSEQGLNTLAQIQSDSGLIHSIPNNLMDQVHKIGNVVYDLSSIKTEGVKTNVLYGKKLLAEIAKLNPEVQVHFVSDLNHIKDSTIRANLNAGGFFVPEQNTAFLYPKSAAWESSALELLNHELVHAVTERSIFDGQVSQNNLNKLNEIIDSIKEHTFANYASLTEHVNDRLDYATTTNPIHEVLAVGIAETQVRQVLHSILGADGLQQLNSIFTEISTEQEKQNEQRKQSGNPREHSKGNTENVPEPTDGITEEVSGGATSAQTDRKFKRNTSNPSGNLSGNESSQSHSTVNKTIQDFGEKIGGARKDTAVKTGKKIVAEKSKDDRPTWAKRFVISEVAASSNPAEVGKWTISDNKNKDWMGNNRRLTNQIFNTQKEAESFLPVAAVAMKHRITTDTKDGKKGYIIVRTVSDRKHVQVVQQLFDTREEANDYLVRHAQEILETNTTFGELDLPRPENTQRTGVTRREGDAKDSDFSRVFGFRGVEFGNWNNQVERQELLNDAFDGLMDLAEVLNIPPEALSLNGELALAFGARGQGLSSAKAHYESNRVVINLTKMNGAGSLAHEWWHAFDHYLSRQDGSASSAWIQHEDGSRSLNAKSNPADRFASHGFKVVKSGVREDVRNNFEKLMVTLFRRSQAYIEDTKTADEFVARSRDEVQDKLNSIRENLAKQLDPKYYKRFNKPASTEQLAEFDTAAELILTGQLLETEARKNPKSRSTFGGYRHTNDALDKINEIFKAVRGRSGFNADFKGVLDYLRGSMSRYMGRLKLLADAQQSTTKHKLVPTEFAMNAKELDQGRGSDYWTTPHEMSARAFQGYVEDKISAKNARSPFLNYGPENVGIITPYGVKRPFPYGEERVAINQAFDDLIGGLKTEQTDSGKRLYSRKSNNKKDSVTVSGVRQILIDRFGEDTIAELERQGKLEIIQDYQVEGVEGFYYNGKAVLVASNLTAESTVPTFLHELGGHAGFQNMMNQKQYNELMNQFNKLVEQGNPVALAAKMLAEREQGSERQQLEYLPYLLTLSSTMQQRNVIQRNALQKLINNIVSYVKAWVFDNFGINLNLNPDDILALSERMIGQIKHQSSLDLIRQKYHGTSQWMTAPNGAKSHLSEQQWLQVRTPEFKKWFGDWENDAANASQVLDENGEPKVVYHGTATEFNEFTQGHGLLGDGIYLTDSFDTADMYANIRGNNGFVLPLFVNIRNAFKTTGNVSRDKVVEATKSGKYQGVVHQFENHEYIVALEPNQVKIAVGNTGTFNSESSDIRFSRSAKDVIDNLSKNLSNISISSVKDKTGYKFTDWLGIGLSALGRRQLTEIYSKLLPQLNKYNDLAAQMDADKNDAGAEADGIVREWANLKDENQLAELMHDATLAKIDPTKPYVKGDSVSRYKQLRDDYNSLSPEAQSMYLKARDAYKKHYAKVHQAIKERILRSELSSQKKADLLKQMDDNFFGYVKGVYFPLARFGKYVVVMRNQNGEVESVSRAETMGEAQRLRSELMQKYPHYKTDRVMLDKAFNASRDAVGRGFMTSLFAEVDNLGLSTAEQAEFEDTLSQLYLSSMPDLSWAKHGIHRKGTAGFSQDARRAFAQNMFHGAGYLAKLRFGDQLAQQLDDMQKYASEQSKLKESFDQPTAQRVIDEMNNRHDNLMNPKSHPLSSALTSFGFIYYLGLSPAAAMVNLSQTALVAYPIMGAKWGFDKAANELLKASNDFRKGVEFHKVKWEGSKTDLYKSMSADISKFLNNDEKQAYDEAVSRGVIDVTQAHDLAGIAQGEDSGIMWKTRPIMRAASVLFHNAERFNREVTFIASYRLARQAGVNHESAFDQAVDATYRGHFDYSSGNRPRIMQGNVAKVLLLFKQFGQNMVYTLARQTYQSIKGETEAERKEARKSLGAILAMHATFAGTLGLPMVGMLLSVASWMGGDDDEPWDAEVALRNYLAEAFGPTISNLLMKGAPRALTPIDLSGRVGINNMLLPDVQEGLEGKRWAESAMAGALGPVAGIGTNLVKGGQYITEGQTLRGIETMLPVFLKNFAKTYRYADEGVQDKTGVSIMDEVSSMDLLVQGMGFSPSDVRTANEGKTAIYQLNRKLNERRSRLMTLWSRAKMLDDQQEMGEIWEEIQGFNDKNPSRRITRINLNQSYRNRQRRIVRAEDGIYLSRNRQDAREAGYFAFGE